IIYFLTASLGLALVEKSAGVAAFWPAAGVASGFLIAVGPAARWPVIIGVMGATIGAHLVDDGNVASSIVFAFANAGEAALIAGLIERFFGARFELNNLRRVIGLFIATILATNISGILGTFGFVAFHGPAPTAPVMTIWLHWLTSDAIGTIIIAP